MNQVWTVVNVIFFCLTAFYGVKWAKKFRVTDQNRLKKQKSRAAEFKAEKMAAKKAKKENKLK